MQYLDTSLDLLSKPQTIILYTLVQIILRLPYALSDILNNDKNIKVSGTFRSLLYSAVSYKVLYKDLKVFIVASQANKQATFLYVKFLVYNKQQSSQTKRFRCRKFDQLRDF